MNRLQQIAENHYAGSWCRGIIVSGLLGIASQSVALEITGFQPASGVVGETVHVSGSGLDAVTSLSMGGESMVLEQISSTILLSYA